MSSLVAFAAPQAPARVQPPPGSAVPAGRWSACKPLSRGPLVLVVNPRTTGAWRDRVAAVCDLLEIEGRAHVLVEAQQSLERCAREAAEHAASHGGALIALGGDGSLSAVGAAAWRAGCPLGLLPLGSANYFAREHGLPAEPQAAVRSWLQGRVGPAPVGLANGRPFFVNARLGLDPLALRERAPPSAWAGLRRLWRATQQRRQRRHYRLQADGERLSLHTPLLFIGNNNLQLGELGVAEALLPGQLLALSATRPLEETGALQQLPFQLLRVWPQARVPGGRPPPLQLACDGELQDSCSSLQLEAAAKPLCLIGAATWPM